MEGPRKVTIPLDVFIKRSWPLFAAGAVFLLFTSGILLWFALSGKGRTIKPPTIPPVEASSTTTGILIPRALDGVLVDPQDARLLSYAVMIDNHPNARPSSGLAEANFVIEAPVEGGMTRYLAVFDATTTVDQIGPVRSARPYFIDFAAALGAVYAHVGGSPEAIEKANGMKSFKNLDEYFYGKYFWRSSKRYAPHNTYTRTDLLRDAATALKWNPSNFRTWRYGDDAQLETTTGTARGTVTGPTVSYGAVGDISWSYVRTENVYERKINGVFHAELDSSRVRAKNVIVLLTEAEVLDAEGRLKMRTTGRGNALLYRDGRMQRLVWRRTAAEQFQFETIDGVDAQFNRGTTWIEVVTSPSVFSKNDPTFSTGSTSTKS